MTKVRIPTNASWSQPNKGDIFGNLYTTTNVDLRTNPGKLKVSPRMSVITKDNDSSITAFGLPIGIQTHLISSTEINIIATGAGDTGAGTGKVFANSAVGFGAFQNLSAFSANSNEPTQVSNNFSDMVSWSGKETNTLKRTYVSIYTGGSHDIYQLESATWNNAWFSSTRSGSNLVNGAPVNLCPGFNGNLYICQEFQIMYAPLTGSIVKPSSATDANTTANTIHTLGKYVVTWMVSSSNRLWVGLMEATNGSTTSHLGGYVAEWDGGATADTSTAFNKIYKINAPSALACTIVNEVPYIIDAYGVLRKFNGTGFEEVARLPVANLNIEMPGIYNMYSNARWIHPRGMTVNDGKILINLNNFVSTGVYINEMPSGVWEFDTQNPSQGIHHRNSPCADSNDYGQQLVKATGAIFSQRVTGGNYLAGVSYYTDATTNRLGIFYDDINTTTSRRAIISNTWIDSNEITDTFQKIYYRFRQLVLGSKIRSKYRTDKSATLPFVATVTWTSTTTFTSTDANFQYASDKDEVEVVQGKGASTTAHISGAPTSNAGTYTVTLDDTIGFSSGTAKVRVDNFHPAGDISTLNTGSAFGSMNQKDNSIQVKTELRDEGGMELNDLTIIGVVNQKAE